MQTTETDRVIRGLILLMVIGWPAQSHAFFCLPFGNDSYDRSHRFRAPRTYLPPMPLPVYPPISSNNNPAFSSTPEGHTPVIAPSKTGPEIIQGYRFRPRRDRQEMGTHLQPAWEK